MLSQLRLARPVDFAVVSLLLQLRHLTALLGQLLRVLRQGLVGLRGQAAGLIGEQGLGANLLVQILDFLRSRQQTGIG